MGKILNWQSFSIFLVVIALVAFSFGAGYWYCDRNALSKAEAEDYVLSNILANVGYARYLERGDYANLRQMIDVNLNDAIFRVRRYQGTIDDQEFVESKIRTLNAAAKLWEEHPPFTSGQWQHGQLDESLRTEWEIKRAENMRLLSWAKEQCSINPSLRCKPANVIYKK